jgi:hypothetical protein
LDGVWKATPFDCFGGLATELPTFENLLSKKEAAAFGSGLDARVQE